MSKLPEIEIWGNTYPIDVSKVTIEDWQKMMDFLAQGNKDAAGHQVVKIVLLALPDSAKRLSVAALMVLIPRVMHEIGNAIQPMDAETELDEILGRNRND